MVYADGTESIWAFQKGIVEQERTMRVSNEGLEIVQSYLIFWPRKLGLKGGDGS